MAKVKSNGNSNWKKHEEEEDEEEKEKNVGNSILAIKTTDDKGHYERQNVKFPPGTIQKLSVIMAEKLRPECRTIHDLIRGYVDRIASTDIMEKGLNNKSELMQLTAKMLKLNTLNREHQAMVFVLQREAKEILDESQTTDEMHERIINMMQDLPEKYKRVVRGFIKSFKNDFFKGKNKRGLVLSSLQLVENDDEEKGEDEEKFL